MNSDLETIVIVGGGVAGLDLATRLGRQLGRAGKARIVLVDGAPTHFWKPLLHAVAAGIADPANYQIDYARQAADNAFEFVCGRVVDIDRTARRLRVAVHAPYAADTRRVLRYDRLVLSLGSVTNFFGVAGAERYCLSLDSVAQAEAFRQRFLRLCASSAQENVLDIVIVGGGPTGVELAADLRDTVDLLVRYRLSALGSARQVRIRIIERSARLLSALDASVSLAATRQLEKLGIEVCTGTSVSRVTEREVLATDGRSFPAAITVWAAGVKGPDFSTRLGLRLNENSQILVDEQLRTLDDPRIHAMGDCCCMRRAQGTAMFPPSAQAARQQSAFLFQLLTRTGDAPRRFHYRDYGALVTLGRHGTVGILLRAIGKRDLRVKGALARMIYRMTYEGYVLANVGVAHMLGRVLARWLRSKMLMPVKWH